MRKLTLDDVKAGKGYILRDGYFAIQGRVSHVYTSNDCDLEICFVNGVYVNVLWANKYDWNVEEFQLLPEKFGDVIRRIRVATDSAEIEPGGELAVYNDFFGKFMLRDNSDWIAPSDILEWKDA